jgi:uncharacterized protein (TIGR02145 family)
MKNTIGWNNYGNSTNRSKFSGLPGGEIYTNAVFWCMGTDGNWWSTLGDFRTKYAPDIWLSNQVDIIGKGNASMGDGLSVRCVKDN